MRTTAHTRSMLKYLAAALLIVHGAIHAAGFAWAFQLAEFDDLGGPTLFLETSEPGDPLTMALGGLWLVAALAFVSAGLGIASASWWGLPLAGAAAAVSLVVTVTWWSDALIGALLSGTILFWVAMVDRAGEGRHTRSPFAARVLRARGNRGTS